VDRLASGNDMQGVSRVAERKPETQIDQNDRGNAGETRDRVWEREVGKPP